MNVLKKAIFLLLFFCLQLNVLANKNTPTVEVWTKSGERIAYSLSEHPVITYSGMDLVLTTTHLTVNYPLAELHKFTFGTEATAIEPIPILFDGQIRISGEMLILSGFSPSKQVLIYSIEGQKVLDTTISSDGSITIDIKSLTTGIYVVKAGGITHKIIKK